MAESPLERQKRQRILVIIFSGLLIVIGVFLYQIFWRPPASPLLPGSLFPVSEEGSKEEAETQSLQVNLDILLSRLRQLTPHGIIPIEIGPLKRENPYVPF